MELIEASKVHETIIDYRDKATNVESEIELERAYGANDVGMLISQLPVIEAIPKDQYEARLKADMVAMLTELLLEIEQCGVEDSHWIVKEKINALKEQNNDEQEMPQM